MDELKVTRANKNSKKDKNKFSKTQSWGKKNISTLLIFGGFISILGLWGYTFLSFTLENRPIYFDVGARGTFGDMFGGLNALFSGLAFAGIILSLFLQRKDLNLQRKDIQYQQLELNISNDTLKAQLAEFELTRKTLENQQTEMASQNLLFEIQRFEGTFFSMLDLHHDIVSKLKIGKSFEGRQCFDYLYDDLEANWKKSSITSNSKERALIAYEITFNTYDHLLHHYFRNLYTLIQIVDEAPILKKINILDERFKVFYPKRYTGIIRAQLSKSEIRLLFYHCISKNSHKYFIKYVEKFGILRTFDKY